MARVILCFLILQATFASGQTYTRQQLRDFYLHNSDKPHALDSFAIKLSAIKARTAIEESYYGICEALKIQYVNSMGAKLKLLVKAKGLLNHAVERDGSDPELRFLRFALEHYLPAFLGMNKHIPEDLKVIFAHADFIDDNLELKRMVVEFLLSTHRCTPEQNNLLQAQLDKVNKKVSAVN